MPERTRLIRSRADALFRRENTSPQITLDHSLADSDGRGRIAVSDEVRKEYYKCAEQELLAEGKIRPV